MADTIILDPTEVSTGRTQLDITAYAKAEGIDWGDAAIEAFMAERERGSAPVDFRIPNRQITIPMNLKTLGAVSYSTARSNLQAKVGRIQPEGGWLKRTTASGTLFLDLVNATLHLGGDWMQARVNTPVDTDVVLTLEAIPDWYGAETTLADHVEVTQDELIWTDTNVAGNYPGRVRLVVDNDSANAQAGLLWGVRSRHYSSSTTAALRYNPSTCTPMDAASVSGGGIFHPNISAAWTPVMSTDQSGVALTHTGTYRVWARCQSTATVPPRVRLVWDVGDFQLPAENAAVRLPARSQLYPMDLGEVRLDRVPAGNHRWRGVIQAAGDSGGESISIDKLWIVPVDEGYGVLRAPRNLDPGLGSFSARDEFNQTAGALSGKALAVGGAWSGTGDTDDFVVNASVNQHVLQRTTVADVFNTGRVALAGTTNFTNVVVQMDFQSAGPFIAHHAVFARWVDINNWLMLSYTGDTIRVRKRVAGAVTDLAIVPAMLNQFAWYTLRLAVDAAGQVQAWCYLRGSAPGTAIPTSATELVTGGALQTGRIGIYDEHITSTVVTRYYDNFWALVPQYDAVLYPNQSAELRTEGMFREESTGTAYGPVSHVTGDLPRIPPSGVEGRTVQFFVKMSRGDFQSLPDPGLDDVSARAFYRPSYLLTN